MASTPKRFLRSSISSLLCNKLVSPEFTQQTSPYQVDTLAHALEADDRSLSYHTVTGTDPTLAPPQPTTELSDDADLLAEMRHKAHTEAEFVYMSRV